MGYRLAFKKVNDKDFKTVVTVNCGEDGVQYNEVDSDLTSLTQTMFLLANLCVERNLEPLELLESVAVKSSKYKSDIRIGDLIFTLLQ